MEARERAGNGPGASVFFEGHEYALLDHVKARNESILAHGFEPITREPWARMSTWFEAAVVPVLVAELALAAERERFPQLPDIYELWDRIGADRGRYWRSCLSARGGFRARAVSLQRLLLVEMLKKDICYRFKRIAGRMEYPR